MSTSKICNIPIELDLWLSCNGVIASVYAENGDNALEELICDLSELVKKEVSVYTTYDVNRGALQLEDDGGIKKLRDQFKECLDYLDSVLEKKE